MSSLRFLSPTLVLSAFSFALFGLHTVSFPLRRQVSYWLALAGLGGSLALVPTIRLSGILFGHGMLISDSLSTVLSWLVLVTGAFIVLLSEKDRSFEKVSMALYYGLLLLSITGLIFTALANDFLMIFLAIELVGIPSFILVGYLRHREKASEGAIKFFLIGAFSAAMLVYGISILYGITGSTSLSVLHTESALLLAKPALSLVAIFFVVVSLGFKIALVPFHTWVPDSFEGAPTPVAAYLSVAPKIAGVVIAVRVFYLSLPSAELGVVSLLAVLAVLTMTIGNVIGLQQTNVVRMLAYSSIVHMGYMILGLIAGSPAGLSSIYLYGWVYLFMNLGAFAIVISMSKAMGSSELADYAGLAKRSPLLSALLVLFLVSLAGLPPTAGFIAKFYVFSAAYKAGWIWLVIVAAANSVISVGYYFKILHAMYFKKPDVDAPIELGLGVRLVLGVASFATLLLGIAPQFALSKVTSLVAQPVPAQAPEVITPATPSEVSPS